MQSLPWGYVRGRVPPQRYCPSGWLCFPLFVSVWHSFQVCGVLFRMSLVAAYCHHLRTPWFMERARWMVNKGKIELMLWQKRWDQKMVNNGTSVPRWAWAWLCPRYTKESPAAAWKFTAPRGFLLQNRIILMSGFRYACLKIGLFRA